MALMQDDERLSQLAILTQALPVLTDYLKAAEARREAQAAELSAAITAEIHIAKEQLATAYQSSIQAFLADRVFQLAPAPVPAPVPVPVPERGGFYSRSISPGVATSSAEDSEYNAEIRGAKLEGVEPPKYRMSRAVKTVKDLWREWTVGFRGGPSVTALDNRWGSRWRAGRQAEVQWYSLRLEVIREIRRVARVRRISEDAAMHFVGAEQRQSNCSLDLYCKRLRANRKTRGGLVS